MVTISVTKRIKTIFTFCTGTGKHFIGNAHYTSDDSANQLTHFQDKQCLLPNPIRKKPKESNIENEGAWVTGDTFLAMIVNTALRHVPVGTVFQLR
jgi:hypothetical protein